MCDFRSLHSRIALLAPFLVAGSCAQSAITLIGSALILADASDLSGLTGEMGPEHIPRNRLGSFGSAIAYSGVGNRYVAAADRGPSNGESDFRCRFHTFEIAINPGAPTPVTIELIATTLLSDDAGRPFTGLASAFDPTGKTADLRLDPEGIRISAAGTILISDEYGPSIAEFSREGRLIRRLDVPAKFQIAKRAGDKTGELPPHNASGRASNRGFEGLAISPDGRTLFAALQSPLIQDHAVSPSSQYSGTNDRLLRVDLAAASTSELLYPLDDPGHGINEMLAVNDHQFLVIERDSLRGEASKFKHIMLVDASDATDISGIAALPRKRVPEGVKPVAKRLFLDLLDAKFGLAGPAFPEKIEGLTFGPDLPDGRHTLIVTSDNDFRKDEPNWFWVFAIDTADLPGMMPQRVGSGQTSSSPGK